MWGVLVNWLFLFINKSDRSNPCPCPRLIRFLCILVLATYVFLEDLVTWWSQFFASDEVNVDEPEPSRPRQVIAAIKRPPKILVRLSSAYFKPFRGSINAVGPQKRRNFSDPHQKTVMEEEEDDSTTHRRHQSSAIQNVVSPRASIDNKECYVCCDKTADAVIMECGHGGICYECSLEMWKVTGQCHMCRMDISQVLQIEPQETQIFKVISTTRAVYKNEE